MGLSTRELPAGTRGLLSLSGPFGYSNGPNFTPVAPLAFGVSRDGQVWCSFSGFMGSIPGGKSEYVVPRDAVDVELEALLGPVYGYTPYWEFRRGIPVLNHGV
jgi:hypothetical protein